MRASGAVSYTHLDVYKRQVLVSAIPMRMMCTLLHVLPNGLAAEAGTPLLDTGVIVPGMCLSITWFVFVTVLFLKWFERREVK